jgi:hypothetical protein
MKCLIAGMPSTGKTTYIGALSYLLNNPVVGQSLSFAETPADLSYLNRLQQPWLSIKKVDRTQVGSSTNIELNLRRNSDDSVLSVSLPDIAGENFQAIVQKQSQVIRDWNSEPDSLMLFVKDLNSSLFADELPKDDTIADSKLPSFDLKDIANDVQNVLILKELRNLFPWKKLVICFAAWDEFEGTYSNPREYLEQNSRFMSNFLKRYFPDTKLFGVSAQGGDYNAENEDALIEKTENGQRSFVVTEDGSKLYDLTLPLSSLI